jgi:HAE1 family hydrophobic/amphiphilic exporter-1
VFERFEAWAEENLEAFHCDTYSANFTRRNGTLSLYLKDDIEQAARSAIPRRLREALPVLPGVETTIGFEAQGSGKEFRLILEGPDFDVVADTAEQVAEVLKRLQVAGADGAMQDLFETVKTDLDDGLEEVHVLVDRERSHDLGVNPQGLQGMIAWGLSGQRLPDLALGDTELAVLIEYGKTDEESLEFLRGLEVPTDTGGMVPLATVAGLGFERTLSTRLRRNGRTSMGIQAVPSIDDVYAVSLAVAEVKRQFPLPEGYRWDEEGGREEVEEDLAELFKTLGMSIALVYLLMSMLLESVVLPLATLVSIELALLGVNFALALFGQPTTPMVYIGMILLAGIVVNNGIVLLDHVQRLRQAGLARREALLQGGIDRVRPILMTALTTICGLLPMAAPGLFPGSGNRDYQGMAIAVAGGLAVSTALTLLVVPLFYTLLEDLAGILRRLARWHNRPEPAVRPLRDPPAA